MRLSVMVEKYYRDSCEVEAVRESGDLCRAGRAGFG